ncbi:WbqC family protein [Sphingobacterium faecale]|uniref:WbqC family protein n=1 Tax=Sphingobacterium faecale TaxID=2803775 RepID=A0ABS1R3P7_9SPHI|nr:WbqC family protein [Sphingobacterium faecale]MBL1409322.1 WbqC family protein [Sphingobacterium faecale]
MSNPVLLSANYLPPVSYFHAIAQNTGTILLDQHEHFPKQTYRSRTHIATANGILDLMIPIQHGRKEHVAMKEVKISYDHDWQRLHWASIQTAYRSSAYFEYYEDEFAPFYERQFEFLFDFNREQLELMLRLLKIQREIQCTDRYVKNYEGLDFRTSIHPKKASLYANPKVYYQVFEEKTGFQSNVSIIDLLFNQGPQSKMYL